MSQYIYYLAGRRARKLARADTARAELSRSRGSCKTRAFQAEGARNSDTDTEQPIFPGNCSFIRELHVEH